MSCKHPDQAWHMLGHAGGVVDSTRQPSAVVLERATYMPCLCMCQDMQPGPQPQANIIHARHLC